jgi:hypothetical protein
MNWTITILVFACSWSALASAKFAKVSPSPNEKGVTLIGPDPEYECTGNGAFPHEVNCELFYDCYNDLANLMACTEDTLFDTSYNGCGPSDTVDCGDRVRPNGTTNPTTTGRTTTTTRRPGTNPPGAPECTPDHHGAFFPHAFFCEQYFECDNYDAILHYCENNLLFDLTFNGCNYPHLVDCGDRTRPPPEPTTGTDAPPEFECDPESNGAFPHEKYCEKYWDCYNGVATLMECVNDYLFEPKWSGCEHPDLVDCGDRIRPNGTTNPPPTTTTTTTTKRPGTDPPPEFECDPEKNGAFPHETYCEKYWDCYNGVATLLECRDDTLFEIKWSGCEQPELVDCGDRIRPNGTTGPVITTTTTSPPVTGETTTTRPPVTGEPGFTCPEKDGNFADPNDCRSFYQCSNYTPYHQTCPVILRFHETTKICDFPENVDCGTRPTPGPTN